MSEVNENDHKHKVMVLVEECLDKQKKKRQRCETNPQEAKNKDKYAFCIEEYENLITKLESAIEEQKVLSQTNVVPAFLTRNTKNCLHYGTFKIPVSIEKVTDVKDYRTYVKNLHSVKGQNYIIQIEKCRDYDKIVLTEKYSMTMKEVMKKLDVNNLKMLWLDTCNGKIMSPLLQNMMRGILKATNILFKKEIANDNLSLETIVFKTEDLTSANLSSPKLTKFWGGEFEKNDLWEKCGSLIEAIIDCSQNVCKQRLIFHPNVLHLVTMLKLYKMKGNENFIVYHPALVHTLKRMYYIIQMHDAIKNFGHFLDMNMFQEFVPDDWRNKITDDDLMKVLNFRQYFKSPEELVSFIRNAYMHVKDKAPNYNVDLLERNMDELFPLFTSYLFMHIVDNVTFKYPKKLKLSVHVFGPKSQY